MARDVFCEKLKQNLEGLATPPIPGPLGERIFKHISSKAWAMWLGHQTMLINEYRLSLIDPKARQFLQTEMENYFFGAGSDAPEGYVPQQE